MKRIIEAFENLTHPDLVAKALKVTPERLNAEIVSNNIDITKYIEKANKEISEIDISKDFNVSLAYKHKKMPPVITEELSDKIYNLINKERDSVLSFLKKLNHKNEADYYESVIFADKIQIYGKIIDRYCKSSLRKNCPVKWDVQLNDFCKSYSVEIKNFNNKGYSLTYNDVLDSYILKKDEIEKRVPVEKPFLFMLQDILKIKDSDLKDLIPYYLALKSHKDSEKITKIWLFSKLLEMEFRNSLKKS